MGIGSGAKILKSRPVFIALITPLNVQFSSTVLKCLF